MSIIRTSSIVNVSGAWVSKTTQRHFCVEKASDGNSAGGVLLREAAVYVLRIAEELYRQAHGFLSGPHLIACYELLLDYAMAYALCYITTHMYIYISLSLYIYIYIYVYVTVIVICFARGCLPPTLNHL